MPEHVSKSSQTRSGPVLGPLVFVLSFVTLFVEMTLPKLFQFLKVFGHEMSVVAVAMLGLGVAGLVAFHLERRQDKALALGAVMVGPTVALAFFAAIFLPNLGGTGLLGHFAMAGLTAIVCALPYFFAGLVTSLAYVKSSSWRTYGLSMLGAGLGIGATYVFLPLLGAEGAMLGAAALAGLTALVAAPRLVGEPAKRWSVASLGLLLASLALFGLQVGTGAFDVLRLSPRHPRAGELSVPGQFGVEAMRLPGSRLLESKWSAIARVDALETPSLTMEGLSYPGGASFVESPLIKNEIAESFQTTLHLYANNIWFSSMPSKVPLKSWVLPYTLLEKPKVLVIGVGGGIDLARALALDPEVLIGVEINPGLVKLMKGPLAEASGAVYNRADVRVMDGRSFVHFTDERFDLVNLVFADLYIPFHNSNIFMESYLYTVEGFEDYIEVLSDDGYLAVTKMVGSLQAPTELLRITATAVEASRRTGAEHPENNVVVVGFSSGREDVFGGTMLVKRTSFTKEELAEVRSELAPPLFELYLPGATGPDNPFRQLVTATDPQAFYDGYPLNVEPPTDDKPFFYLFDRSQKIHRDYVIFFLMITGLFFWVPFVAILSRQGRYREPAYYQGAAIIALLALGYVFVESALIQKLNLYLGGPLYSLSAVSAAFLTYPGVAGLLVGRIPRAQSAYALLAPPLALLLYEPLLTWLVGTLPPFEQTLRVLIVFTLLAPLCLPLGLPFPFMVERLKAGAGERSAGLFFGVSAIAGVVVVALSLYWSARFGIRALYFTGAGAYVVVALGAIVFNRKK